MVTTIPTGIPLPQSCSPDRPNGTLTLNPDGSFVYTPNAGFRGTDSFLYEAWDGSASSAATLVKINVSPAIIIFPALPPVNPIDPPAPDPSDDPVDEQDDPE